jgi:RNase P/RNase MRP subunit POP5
LQRQRYVLFEYLNFAIDVEIPEKEVIRTIWKTLTQLFGEYTAYKTGLWLIEFNPDLKYGIIRCNNITKDQIITALAFIQEIRDARVIIHSIKTSGTIKKVKDVQKHFFDKNR